MSAIDECGRATCWAVIVSLLVTAAGSSRYGFYRQMGGEGRGSSEGGGTRRVFGGSATELSAFPAACALLDRYWAARCSGAVVAPRWVLTAAHCVSPRIAYIKYNNRRPSSPDGDVAPVHYLYRHPGYKVLQEDEGRGMDVTLLHHDVGLVRTRVDMRLANAPPLEPLAAMRLHNPIDLHEKEVKVFGFGRTESSLLGEELFSVRLRLVSCERGSWFHCVCGVSGDESGDVWGGGDGSGRAGGSRGVCSGDSGGPVVFGGAQVGVTSMGPLECASRAAVPDASATSVFTALYSYAALVNSTIHDTDRELQMRMISGGGARRSTRLLLALAAACSVAIVRCAAHV